MNRYHRALIALCLLALPLWLASLHRSADAADYPTGEHGWPVTEGIDKTDSFDPWQSWSPRANKVNFDMDRCAALLTGYLNHDTLTDAICPYNRSDGNKSTFVQLATWEPSERGYIADWQSWSAVGSFDLTRCTGSPTGLFAADVDGDGLTDLICPYDFGSSDTRTFIQQATPTGFTAWKGWSSRTGAGVFDLTRCKGIHTGDANRDGRADLICPYLYANGDTKTFVQEATPTNFTSWLPWSPLIASAIFDLAGCHRVEAAHLTLDRRTDLLCLYLYDNGDTQTFAQISVNSFYRDGWQEYSPLALVGDFDLTRCATIQTGHLNLDGRADLLCPYDYGSGDTRTFVQIATSRGYPRGWEARSSRTGPGGFDLTRCKTILAGDVDGQINGDGLTDLVCPYNFGNGETQTFVQIAAPTGYTSWIGFSERSDPNTLNLNRCRQIALAYLNPGALADLLCHYTYPAGNTNPAGSGTFAQLGPILYETFLPESRR